MPRLKATFNTFSPLGEPPSASPTKPLFKKGKAPRQFQQPPSQNPVPNPEDAAPPMRERDIENLSLRMPQIMVPIPQASPTLPVIERAIPLTYKDEVKKFGKLDTSTGLQLAMLRVQQNADRSPASLITRILSRLPTPHPKQLEIELSTAKRKVVNTARRVGKTTEATRIGIIKTTEGRRVLFASPSQDQVDAFWDNCKAWLAPMIDSGELIKNETRRIIEMPSTGGRLRAKTASDADMLRGDYADFLVLDECALLDPKAWDEVGAPMLLDNDGDAWFLSTPRRRNWFFGLYQRAIADTTGRWQAFHATSFDNPHLSQEALEEIIADLTDDAYKQEILAIFLEGDGQVFRNINACLTAPLNSDRNYHESHFKVMGVDWGQRKDYTALCCFCATCMQELALDRFRQTEWIVARERLITLYKEWGVRLVLAEENAMGSPNIEALSQEGINIQPFNTNVKTKAPLIRALSLAFERNMATWLPDEVAKGELEAYEAITSRITAHTQYSAPKGMNDDTVIARALAYQAASNGIPSAGPQARAFSEMSAVSDYQGHESGQYEEGAPSYREYDNIPLSGYTLPMNQSPSQGWR